MEIQFDIDINKRADRILWLDYARVLAIIAVSLNHAVAVVYGIFKLSYDDFNIGRSFFSEIFRAASFVFSRLGVPVFLMVTGALLLGKKMDSREGVVRFYKYNWLPLFIAAELWYGIMFLVISIWDPAAAAENHSVAGWIHCFLQNALFINQKTFDSMWYMRMILLVYLLIPIAVVAKDNSRQLMLSILAVAVTTIIITFIIPDIIKTLNAFEVGSNRVYSLAQGHLLSQYWIYIGVGYWISREGLAKIRFPMISSALVVSFICTVVYQYIVFEAPKRVAIGYECTLLLICSVFLFEFLRRLTLPVVFHRFAVYISRISLAIYFIHIIILSLVDWYVVFPTIPKSVHVLLLWGVSFFGSILLIAVLSRIEWCRRVLFIMK